MSIFSQIIQGEIPAYKIFEDESNLAFLDIFPIARGHVLVVPKKEIDYIFDMSSDDYTQLFLFAKKIADAMKKVFDCDRIGLSVIGLDVPHVHIHLIPINKISDMNFENQKLEFTKKEFSDIANMIRNAI